MSEKGMRTVKFLRRWRAYAEGDVRPIISGVADILVTRKIAEYADEDEKRGPEAMVEEPARNAMKPSPRKRKKRKIRR